MFCSVLLKLIYIVFRGKSEPIKKDDRNKKFNKKQSMQSTVTKHAKWYKNKTAT